MRNLFILFFLLISSVAYSQAIIGGAGVCHTNGDPDAIAALGTQTALNECLIAYDTLGNALYVYDGSLTVGNRWTAVPLSTVVDTDTRIDSISVASGNLNFVVRDIKSSAIVKTISIALTDIAPVQSIVAGNGIIVSSSNGTRTISAVDSLVTNEGRLGVAVGGASDAQLTTNTSGSNPVTLAGTGMVTVTESVNTNGGTITFNVNPQTLTTVTSSGTATITLSNASAPNNAFSITGSGITVTQPSGTGLVLTATDASTTNELQNLTFTGSASPFTLDISNGTDVTFTSGSGITITRSTNDLSFAAVDASISNEGLLSVGAGGTNTSTIVSNTSGSNTITISGTDGSIGVSESTVTNTITIAFVAKGEYASVSAASTAGVTSGQYFYASTANEMGVPPGTLIRMQ